MTPEPASAASKATGMPLVTNQPLSGEIGLMTVVVGAVLSILRVSGALDFSTLPARSVLQNAMVWVPSVPKAKAPSYACCVPSSTV